MIESSERSEKSPKSHETRGECENHYKELVEFFKHLVWLVSVAVGIVVAVGALFLYHNIDEVKRDAKKAIDKTRENANADIEKIRVEAGELAREEAKRNVEQAFKENNIQLLVESTAKKEVGDAVDRRVRVEVDKSMASIQEEIKSLGKLSDSGARLRLGMRAGLDGIWIVLTNAANQSTRDQARSLLISIANDYEAAIKADMVLNSSTNILEYVRRYTDFPAEIPIDTCSNLLQVIRTESNMRNVALAYFMLREKSGRRFQLFSEDAVETWLRDYPEELGR